MRSSVVVSSSVLCLAVALSACVLVLGAVTFDPVTGTGFVGKGDVQTALGINNKQLQEQAANLQFTYTSIEVKDIEYTWTCRNDKDKTQERSTERTTETSTQSVLSAIARERNQITGFNLIGYSGTPTTTTKTTGPSNAIDSCPTGWVVEDSKQTITPVSSTSFLSVTNGQTAVLSSF